MRFPELNIIINLVACLEAVAVVHVFLVKFRLGNLVAEPFSKLTDLSGVVVCNDSKNV